MVVSDSITIAKRNVIKIKRVPDVLIFTTMSPIMFVLMFAYVFGSAIKVPGMEGGYREFLIAGIFVQTVVFGASFTGAGLAEDMQKGIIDRFRTLPMASSAVLVGRTISDVVINIVTEPNTMRDAFAEAELVVETPVGNETVELDDVTVDDGLTNAADAPETWTSRRWVTSRGTAIPPRPTLARSPRMTAARSGVSPHRPGSSDGIGRRREGVDLLPEGPKAPC